MSRELETRNRTMYQMYAAGKSMQAIADTFDITRQRAAQIIARYAAEATVSDDESRSLEYTQLEGLQNEMLKIAYSKPQPQYDVKGNILYDDNGDPKLDFEPIIKAADEFRKLSDSKRRLIALDLPRRKQLAEDEAMRQVKEYLASLPKAQVEDP